MANFKRPECDSDSDLQDEMDLLQIVDEISPPYSSQPTRFLTPPLDVDYCPGDSPPAQCWASYVAATIPDPTTSKPKKTKKAKKEKKGKRSKPKTKEATVPHTPIQVSAEIIPVSTDDTRGKKRSAPSTVTCPPYQIPKLAPLAPSTVTRPPHQSPELANPAKIPALMDLVLSPPLSLPNAMTSTPVQLITLPQRHTTRPLPLMSLPQPYAPRPLPLMSMSLSQPHATRPLPLMEPSGNYLNQLDRSIKLAEDALYHLKGQYNTLQMIEKSEGRV